MIEFRPRTVTDVVCNGAVVDLTPQERTVLDALVAAEGEYVSRTRMNTALGGVRDKHIDVLICKIRNKLLLHGLRDAIETAWFKGWRWAL
jgi:DNA-binding response OmpR family regulator